MDSSMPTEVLPNPYTPLAFLTPTTANEFEASCYLYVATLAAFIWDWMTAWPDEYRIIFKKPIRASKIVYCLSRLSAFTYIVTSTIFQVAPVGVCQELQLALGTFLAVSIPATSALFYLRVCAVFHNSKPVVIFFGILWLSILSTSFTVPFSIHGAHIGTTDRCINTSVKPVSSSGEQGTARDKFRSFFRGEGLPKLSRMLLQGGQLYYFATVSLNILTMAMIISPKVSPVFHAMFTIPNIALENAMATRVFRAIHLGAIQNDVTSFHIDGISRPPAFVGCGSHGAASGSAGGTTMEMYALETRTFDHRIARCDHIEITRTIETRRDLDDLPSKVVSLTEVESKISEV